MPQKNIQFEWLGKVDYASGLEYQRQAWLRCKDNQDSVVLGLEHPPVVTLGKRADEILDFKTPPARLKEIGYQIAKTDRGGEAVLHNPGQLVIYPMFNLIKWEMSVRDFVELLERTTVRFFQQLQVNAEAGREEPGIYTPKGKIGFVGIRVERGITRHGIALNISNDLAAFSHIRVCGKADENFDRLLNYGVNASLGQLFKRWSQCLEWTLHLTPRPTSEYSRKSLTEQQI
jgi:lipoyl(octanoyl) transferase